MKSKLGEPDIDVFASRLNHKTTHYIAWRPDPGAVAIDVTLLLIMLTRGPAGHLIFSRAREVNMLIRLVV